MKSFHRRAAILVCFHQVATFFEQKPQKSFFRVFEGSLFSSFAKDENKDPSKTRKIFFRSNFCFFLQIIKNTKAYFAELC